MKSLPKPTNKDGTTLDALETFKACISKVRSKELKINLTKLEGIVTAAATQFNVAAATANLHTINKSTKASDQISNNEMIKVYTNRMAKIDAPGRPQYDRIIGATKNRICPLCDIGQANTLDHHLPKTDYPFLVVTPNNLVPSCEWCQGEKGTSSPTSEEEQSFHPYFDNFQSERWLYAIVTETKPAAFKYIVRAPSSWTNKEASRANHHLKTFGLKALYASNAGNELSGMRPIFRNLYDSDGKLGLRKRLENDAKLLMEVNLNHWRSAMYEAAANSEWFCDGGFKFE